MPSQIMPNVARCALCCCPRHPRTSYLFPCAAPPLPNKVLDNITYSAQVTTEDHHQSCEQSVCKVYPVTTHCWRGCDSIGFSSKLKTSQTCCNDDLSTTNTACVRLSPHIAVDK